MKTIAIYTLTSELHDEAAVATLTKEFLASLEIDYDFKGNDYTDYGRHALSPTCCFSCPALPTAALWHSPTT